MRLYGGGEMIWQVIGYNSVCPTNNIVMLYCINKGEQKNEYLCVWRRIDVRDRQFLSLLFPSYFGFYN